MSPREGVGGGGYSLEFVMGIRLQNSRFFCWLARKGANRRKHWKARYSRAREPYTPVGRNAKKKKNDCFAV